MLRLQLCVFLCLNLTCGAALAQKEISVEPERVDEFIEVIAKNECRITNDVGDIYLPAAGFADREEVRAIISRLLYYGRARFFESQTNGGVLVIYDGPCAEGGREADPKTLFLEVVAANGCSLNSTDARPLLKEAGVHMQEVRALLPLLQNDGTISLSEDGETVMLTDEDCNYYGPSPELVTDLIHDPITDPRGALIEFLEVTGCEINYEDAQIALPAAGFDVDSLDKLIPEYLAEGILDVGPNENLILRTGRCE